MYLLTLVKQNKTRSANFVSYIKHNKILLKPFFLLLRISSYFMNIEFQNYQYPLQLFSICIIV